MKDKTGGENAQKCSCIRKHKGVDQKQVSATTLCLGTPPSRANICFPPVWLAIKLTNTTAKIVKLTRKYAFCIFFCLLEIFLLCTHHYEGFSFLK